DDSLTRFEPGPFAFNDASRLLAKNQRGLLGDGKISHPNDPIKRVDGRCLNADENLISYQLRLGQRRHPENVQTTMWLNLYCFHDQSSPPMQSLSDFARLGMRPFMIARGEVCVPQG